MYINITIKILYNTYIPLFLFFLNLFINNYKYSLRALSKAQRGAAI